MPNWNEVLTEIQSFTPAIDTIRRKYLLALSKKTGRNTIAYYSGWLQHPGVRGIEISDVDKNGFMNAIHGLKREKGLDIILHTPGGDVAATESVIDYLRQMFDHDIRAIVPQICMSGGTMIACACKSIIMGKHSNLGPIDPQFNGIPAQGVISEFKKAIKEVKNDPGTLPIWQTIISRYHPTFIGQCEKAVQWSQDVTTDLLVSGMFREKKYRKKKDKAKKIVNWLTDHDYTKNHARHLPVKDCIKNGLVIEKLEDLPNNLQDAVLTVHHAFMHTFANTPAIKIIENHNGKAIVNHIAQPAAK